VGNIVHTPPIPGVKALEWSNPDGVMDATWVVVLGNTPSSTPQAIKLGASGAWAPSPNPPFESLILKRFKQAQRVHAVRLTKLIVEIVGATLAALLVVGFVSGMIQLRMVVSDSMSGTFERGDVLAVVSPRFVPAEVNSIVVFHYYNADRTELIGDFSHRIIGGTASDGWETKGDANPEADLSPVFQQDVVGSVVGWVPKVGHFLQPNILLGVMIIVLMVVVLGPDFVSYIKRRKE
jgi:signal peptidase I